MIEIKRINSTLDAGLYNYMEKLLIASFPDNEYRNLDELKQYTDTNPDFFNNIILDDGKPIGLITYWDLDEFYYIEHFAIDPNQRNGGYGRQTVNSLTGKLNLPVVLEVETPTDDISKRRIIFYQREGFLFWDKEYFQPPYKPGDKLLPMFLMATNGLDPDKDFNKTMRNIYKRVYNYDKVNEE